MSTAFEHALCAAEQAMVVRDQQNFIAAVGLAQSMAVRDQQVVALLERAICEFPYPQAFLAALRLVEPLLEAEVGA